MAGWLGRFDIWERFSDAWAKALEATPSVKYFSHHEAIGLSGQFANWDDDERDQKLMKLASVFETHKLVGFVGGIHLPRFKQLFSGSILPKKTLRSIATFTEPYYYCFNGVVAATLAYQAEVIGRVDKKDKVNFIFDEHQCLDECIAIYPRIKKVLPRSARLVAGTVTPGNDKEIVALQAADFLAGQALLKLRTKRIPLPLKRVLEFRKVRGFECPQDPLNKIPRSLELLNVAWSAKMAKKGRAGGPLKR
jgi:hypothetical protein